MEVVHRPFHHIHVNAIVAILEKIARRWSINVRLDPVEEMEIVRIYPPDLVVAVHRDIQDRNVNS